MYRFEPNWIIDTWVALLFVVHFSVPGGPSAWIAAWIGQPACTIPLLPSSRRPLEAQYRAGRSFCVDCEQPCEIGGRPSDLYARVAGSSAWMPRRLASANGCSFVGSSQDDRPRTPALKVIGRLFSRSRCSPRSSLPAARARLAKAKRWAIQHEAGLHQTPPSVCQAVQKKRPDTVPEEM